MREKGGIILNCGAFLRLKRLARRMTQSNVAEEVEVAVSAINKYELNKRRPTPEVAQRLGKLFDFDWTIFYSEDNVNK